MEGWIWSAWALAIAGISSSIALIIIGRAIYTHLLNYTCPRNQRYIIRILLIVPMYSISSFLTLCFPRQSEEIDILSDIYEAFVIYSFMSLVLEYSGGESNCLELMKSLPPMRYPFPLCCLPLLPRDGRILRLSKKGTLQFVICKLVMASISVIILSVGKYHSSGYTTVQLIIYNISYSVALYCLGLFYAATYSFLAPFNPVQKFLAIKTIIFMTFWQSIVLRAMPGIDRKESARWSEWILCVEMLGFAILLSTAFPYNEFIVGSSESAILTNIKEVLNMKDIVQDAYHNFMPAYQDYVLQHNTETGEKKTVRTRTFIAGNLDTKLFKMNLSGHQQIIDNEIYDDERAQEKNVELSGKASDNSTPTFQGISDSNNTSNNNKKDDEFSDVNLFV